MTFVHPYFMLLLLLLPLMAWMKGRRGEVPSFTYSSVQLLRGVVNISRSRSGGFLAALRWLILALLITALSQPRLVSSETKVMASGVDIVAVLDMSGSMAAEEFQVEGQRVNRINMGKHVLRQFIEKRPNDRIGLVVFASQPYIASPPTLDHDFLLKVLDRLELGVIDASQTAIGSALSTALNRLRELKSKSKIIILMTDGGNNAGRIQPMVAAEAAKALNVKVYTIGIGTHGEAPMPYGYDMFGRKLYRNEPVDLDEDTLKKIADLTGGTYYRADSAERFEDIYKQIDKLEKTDVQVKKYTEFRELFAWFAAPGLGLLLVEVLLANTVFRRLP